MAALMLFADAVVYVRALGLRTRGEWEVWRKTGARSVGLPSHPEIQYAGRGWRGYGHFLGTGAVSSRCVTFLPFEAAAEYVQSLQLRTQKAWRVWSRTSRPANIPSSPDVTYARQGWRGYRHWLGTGGWLPFEQAVQHVRSLGLRTQKDWEAWRKSGARPANIPSSPDATYARQGWRGYRHWLGTAPPAYTFFDERILLGVI